MKTVLTVLTMLFVLVCAGCKEVPIVTASELAQLKTQWKEPKVSIWYYIGTKGGYHYFTHIDIDGTKTYRISEIEELMKNPFSLTSDEKLWRVMNWGVHAKRATKEDQPEPNQAPEVTPRKLGEPQR